MNNGLGMCIWDNDARCNAGHKIREANVGQSANGTFGWGHVCNMLVGDAYVSDKPPVEAEFGQ